jgi:hypothetical protein
LLKVSLAVATMVPTFKKILGLGKNDRASKSSPSSPIEVSPILSSFVFNKKFNTVVLPAFLQFPTTLMEK